MTRPISVDPIHRPTIPITAGNTGGTGTGSLNIVKIAPTAAPVIVHKIISFITIFRPCIHHFLHVHIKELVFFLQKTFFRP